MKNTFNYLKNAFQNLLSETKQNPILIALVFVLISIPLRYAIGSIAVGLFVIITLITYKKSNSSVSRILILPIVLYILMGLSLFWSHSHQDSLSALSKTLPFLLIPICFIIIPNFSGLQRHKIVAYFSHGMVLFAIYYLLKAIIRYAINQDTAVFFYHELVTQDVNAIHVSVYMTIANFYFITKSNKNIFDKIVIVLLTVLLILLSSKNISVVFLGLFVVHFLRYYKSVKKVKSFKVTVFLLIFLAIAFTGKLKDRFLVEYYPNVSENSLNQEKDNSNVEVHNVGIYEAWNNDKFSPNDYFNGTAFRVYQARLFFEFLTEKPIFWKGFGLNASQQMLIEKEKKYNLYNGYGNFNFHNQYIQFFAELGIFGLLLLLTMLFLNLKNALKTKDFVFISFAVLMISLFLTESFLARQRGVIFFIVFYCLFNTANEAKKPSDY